MEQQKEILNLKEDVSSLKEAVENLTILLNRKLINELYKEVENIKNGDYLTEKEFAEKHKIKTLQNL